MSGGTLTDHQYNLYHLINWSQVLRNESVDPVNKDIKEELQWLSDLLFQLEDCLHNVDMVLSGDSGDECAKSAISKLKQSYFTGVGPSDKDLIDIGVYAENILTRLGKIRGKIQ